MTTTFPFGYSAAGGGGQLLTWEQMMQKPTVYNLHPEVQRRFHALIEFAATQGVALGVGTGWRVQPNPPPAGFASPGNSWHESCPVSPVTATALAIDTVPNISWEWMHTHCGAYGLRTFKYVGNEPWHVQPSEISTSRKYATKLPALATWTLPGTPAPAPPTGPTPPPLKDDDTMLRAAKNKDTGNTYVLGDGKTAQTMDGLDSNEIALRVAGGVIDVSTKQVVYDWGKVTPIPGGDVKKYVGAY
jgi:hypothetical protein